MIQPCRLYYGKFMLCTCSFCNHWLKWYERWTVSRRTALVLTVAEIYCHFMNIKFFLRLRPVFVLWDRWFIANSVLYSNSLNHQSIAVSHTSVSCFGINLFLHDLSLPWPSIYQWVDQSDWSIEGIAWIRLTEISVVDLFDQVLYIASSRPSSQYWKRMTTIILQKRYFFKGY